MFNEKDILARLQNGETLENIAAELSTAMNKAQDTYKKEMEAKKKAEESKAKAQALQMAKVEGMAEVLNKFYNFLYDAYPNYRDTIKTAFEAFTAKDVVKLLDETFSEFEALFKATKRFQEDLKSFDFNDFMESFGLTPEEKKVCRNRSSDQVLNEFLKRNQW